MTQSMRVLPGGHLGTQCEAASALRRGQMSGGRALFGPDLGSLDEMSLCHSLSPVVTWSYRDLVNFLSPMNGTKHE